MRESRYSPSQNHKWGVLGLRQLNHTLELGTLNADMPLTQVPSHGIQHIAAHKLRMRETDVGSEAMVDPSLRPASSAYHGRLRALVTGSALVGTRGQSQLGCLGPSSTPLSGDHLARCSSTIACRDIRHWFTGLLAPACSFREAHHVLSSNTLSSHGARRRTAHPRSPSGSAGGC